MANKTQRYKLRKKIFFALISMIIFFIFAEISAYIILKLIKPIYCVEGTDRFIEDAQLGWIFTPNWQKEYDGIVMSYNSEGLRDRNFTLQKEKVFRIIVLSDSISEGYAVEKPFPKILEDLLNEKVQGKYEVMNAGVGDYGIYQEYRLLKERLLKYSPDIVVLSYYLNDARNFVSPKTIFRDKMAKALFAHSAFIKLLNRIILKYSIKNEYRHWHRDRFKWNDAYKEKKWLQDKNEADKVIADADRDWGLAWTNYGMQVSIDYFNKFLLLSKKYNFKLVIACFPVDVQLYSEGANKYDILEPQKKISEFCLRNDIHFLSVLDTLMPYKNEKIMIDHCHYTDLGHKYIALSIYEFLRHNNLL